MSRPLLSALVLAMTLPFAAGCNQSESAAQDGPDKKKKDPRDQFAADQAKDADTGAPFDGKRAMGYLKDLCAIGPRISGSDGMKKQQELLKKHFEALSGAVTFQKFSAKQASRTDEVPMANMIVTWHPDRERRVILCTHYDTRPIADQEPARRDWTKPFVSANDGASGAAWLMELAHHMKDLPLNVGADFILFDGEEYIFEGSRDKYFIGSDYFADDYKKEKPKHKYIAGVLLDLFAGKNAKYPLEQNSAFFAGGVQDSIWKVAADLKVPAFQNRRGNDVLDDHIALNKAGIPTVDIIDFDYAHWHRLSDTPDKCAPESMEQVAHVLTVWLTRIK
jgi:hypothetical protein